MNGEWKKIKNLERALAYMKRNAIVHDYEYKSYQEYLNGDSWKFIRSVAIKQFGNRCFICISKQNLHVHHTDFDEDTLFRGKIDNLYVLCSHCHKTVEYDKDGVKISPQETKNRIEEVMVELFGKRFFYKRRRQRDDIIKNYKRG